MLYTHLFVLEKVSYTYKNTVIRQFGQPTHLPVICSVPDIPMTIIIKKKLKVAKLFHGVLCLERSERNGYKDESNSVSNQRDFIRSFLEKREELVLEEEYVDDGYSGVNFERPAVQRMFADMKKKKINCIIVKDLSRFGRNYIETGRYLEQVFPVIGIRFIAINDGYDSIDAQNQSNDIILPFKNLMNDAYSRDLSIKIRSQLEVPK